MHDAGTDGNDDGCHGKFAGVLDAGVDSSRVDEKGGKDLCYDLLGWSLGVDELWCRLGCKGCAGILHSTACPGDGSDGDHGKYHTCRSNRYTRSQEDTGRCKDAGCCPREESLIATMYP